MLALIAMACEAVVHYQRGFCHPCAVSFNWRLVCICFTVPLDLRWWLNAARFWCLQRAPSS